LFAGFSRSTCQVQAQGGWTILNHTCSIAPFFAQTLGKVFSKTVERIGKSLDKIRALQSHQNRRGEHGNFHFKLLPLHIKFVQFLLNSER